MQIDRVTITGADNSVRPENLIRLSERYPFVEWGILLSKSSMGRPRFPSKDWIEELLTCSSGLKLSGHVCGRWVRDMIQGGDELEIETGRFLGMFQRLQWNFHAEQMRAKHLSDVWVGMNPYRHKQNILQMDGVNDALMLMLRNKGYDVVPLFDTSGGAGIVPAEWPTVISGVYCGYAGGLGPENLETEITRIASVVGDHTIWIDMERKVRSIDDRQFDLEKAEHCLRVMEPLVTT